MFFPLRSSRAPGWAIVSCLEATSSFSGWAMPSRLQIFGRNVLLMIFVVICRGPSFAQDPNPQVNNRNQFPTITYTRSRYDADPAYYSVAVDSTGNATYESTSNSDSQTDLPYLVEFTASIATRTKIFQIAQDLNFFRGSVGDEDADSGLVTNTLTFSQAQTRNQITYSTSSDPLVQRLTGLFEEISTTLEFGRRLSAVPPGDSAAMEAELENIRQMVQDTRLIELQALSPVLRQIASNRRISESCRQLGQAILEIAKVSTINYP